MLDYQYENYVFPQRFRTMFKTSAPIGIIGALAFAIFMWFLSIVQDNDQSACAFVAIVFVLLTLFLIFQYKKNSDTLNMKYALSLQSLSNVMGKRTTCVSFQDWIYCTHISGKMYIYKASVDISFFVFSNEEHKEIELTDNIVKSVKNVFKAGHVIVPDTVKTRAILLPYVNCDSIPEYPSQISGTRERF